MARLIPAELGTHYVAGSAIALLLLKPGAAWVVAGCLAAALGREIYGRWRRSRPMQREDWVEAAIDVAFTLTGGAVVLAAAAIGV